MTSFAMRRLGFDRPIGQVTPTAASMMSWHRRFIENAASERNARRTCLFVGLAMQAAVYPILALTFHVLAKGADKPPQVPVTSITAIFGSLTCFMMLLMALLTKPDGRAETANQLIDSAAQNRGGGNPALNPVLLLIMLMALYGAFAIVEAARRSMVAYRLRHVDRLRAARVMDDIACNPAGLPDNILLGGGESAHSIRNIVALLVFEGWVEMRDGQIVQRGQAMRRLTHRHPLAEIFESVV